MVKKKESKSIKRQDARKRRKASKAAKVKINLENAKKQRKELIENLKKVQLSDEKLAKLISLSSTQTTGFRKMNMDETKINKPFKSSEFETKIPIQKIVSCKRRPEPKRPSEVYRNIADPKIVGFYDDDNSSDEDHGRYSVRMSNAPKPLTAAKKTVAVKTDDNTEDSKPKIYVLLNRKEEVQKNRLKLPILYKEHEIMNEIIKNDIVIVTGETGSGKTTQLPQFLYEAGFTAKANKMIGITEPRRVAAIAMSKRVAEEMNLNNGEVSYLIRFEGNVTDKTKIKFMTDGVLMKELQTDLLLSKYSAIVIDEAHERSVYSDIIIGLLSLMVPLRAKRQDPLKLIIMSATLSVDQFISNDLLFRRKKPPVVEVQSRQFEVVDHFNRVTPDDYLNEAYRKICHIHTNLASGGILVFVTSRAEVKYLVRKLRSANIFPKKLRKSKTDEDSNDAEEQQQLSEIDLNDFILPGEEGFNNDLQNIHLEFEKNLEKMASKDLDSESECDLDDEDYEDMSNSNNAQNMLWVLPLYSMLPTHEQNKIFEEVPANQRLCVISTNVAETSLTIPGIKYVVDTGKAKFKRYDSVTGATKFEIGWISKANAKQRSGRAGRQSDGHCYRLYSSAVFQHEFSEFPQSEIEQRPIDDIVLQLKMLQVPDVSRFPLPTQPDPKQVKQAEEHLRALDLLDDKTNKITKLGEQVHEFPVLPRFGKMIVLALEHNVIEYAIIIVAALSVPELFDFSMDQNVDDDASKGSSFAVGKDMRLMFRKLTGTRFSEGRKLGDIMLLLRLISVSELAHSQGKLVQFCNEHNLRYKAVIEIRKLRLQLTKIVKKTMKTSNVTVNPNLRPPNQDQVLALRQLMFRASIDKIARKIDVDEVAKEDRRKMKFAYQTLDLEDPVFIHCDSVLIKQLPQYVCYQELYESQKLFMRNISRIEPQWILLYAKKICSDPETIKGSETYNESAGKIMCLKKASFGRRKWPLPEVLVEHSHDHNVYVLFAIAVIEGKVFPKLQQFTNRLATDPCNLTKSWAKLLTKWVKILNSLKSRGIFSRDSLTRMWKQDSTYLLNEYLVWIREDMHDDVKKVWPPV